VIWTLLGEFDLGRLRVWIARRNALNSQSMLEHVVDESFDGIVIVDGDGRIARANGEAASLLNSPTPIQVIDDLPVELRQALRDVQRSDTSKLDAHRRRGRTSDRVFDRSFLDDGCHRE
jgi:PAS domain-containing protein